jgi:hypothetical protein
MVFTHLGKVILQKALPLYTFTSSAISLQKPKKPKRIKELKPKKTPIKNPILKKTKADPAFQKTKFIQSEEKIRILLKSV